MNWNPPHWVQLPIFFQHFFLTNNFFFRNKKFFSKEQLLFSFLCIVRQKKNSERSEKFWKFLFLKIYFKKNVQKVGFQFMLILVLLGMYFDAVVVIGVVSLLLFRLPMAILWKAYCSKIYTVPIAIKGDNKLPAAKVFLKKNLLWVLFMKK